MDGKHYSHFKDSEYGFLYHYYRAEVYRETNWRTRLDVTTNWAIVVTSGILSYVFSTPEAPHSLIIMNYLIILFFLYIEARRFRYYGLLRSRTKLMEEELLAPMFSPVRSAANHTDAWWEKLGDSLASPRILMSRMESLAWRARRVYLFIALILFVAWLSRIYTTPQQAVTFTDAINQGRVIGIPGAFIFMTFLLSVAVLMYIAYRIPKDSHEDDLP